MTYGRRPPLDEQKSLWEASLGPEGVTTGAGAVTGDSFIDAGLIGAGANSFVSMMAVIYPGQPTNVDSMDITAFNNATGEVTLAKAYKGVAAAIPAGVSYKIVTFRFVPAEVAALTALVGTPTDVADLGTLFGRHLREYLGTHTHALVVVHDTSALDADLDTALRDWLLDLGYRVTLCDPTDVAGELSTGSFDLVMVSASCVAGDVGNLANLRAVGAPVICHSAAIAASVVLDMGGTPHTHAAQTQIEITDNTPMWLITQALGDLTVTASANIYAMNTKTAAAITLAEEATGTGNHLTAVRLEAGEENEAGYAAFYDRYFIGVGDYTNMNAAWKAVMGELAMHCVMEKRFTAANAIIPDLRSNLCRWGQITAISGNTFTSADLAGLGIDAMPGWWVYVMQADDAAPEGEYRMMTDYTNAGVVSHEAFSAVLEVGDRVQLIHPVLYLTYAATGGSGARSLETLGQEQDADLDVARGTSGAVSVDGGEDNLYNESNDNEFVLLQLMVDLNNMAEGDSITFKIYTTEDGNERKISNDAANTVIGAQDPARYEIIGSGNEVWGREGIRVCAVKVGGTTRAITAYYRDAKRGS